MKDNIEKLKQIAKILNPENIVTPAEIEQVLTAIVGILSNNKKQLDILTEGTKIELEGMLKTAFNKMEEMKSEHSSEMEEMMSKMEEANSMISELKDIQMKDGEDGKNGVDGKDGKPGENGKDGSSDTPIQIVEKLESLAEENRLDVSAIRGLESFIKKFMPTFSRGGGNGGGVQSIISSNGSVGISSTGAKGKGVVDLSVLGGGGGNYTPQGATTATVGGLPSGTNLGTTPVTIQSILDQILYPYVLPSFSSFVISGQSQTMEVGDLISPAIQTFAWAFNTVGNVAPNTMELIDVTGSAVLASGLSLISPIAQNIGAISLSAPGSYSWKGRATNNAVVPATFDSALFTVSWKWREYFGTDSSPTLNAAAIQALANSALANGFTQSSSFVAGDYKYFAWPDSFGSPTAVNGFRDPNSGFNMAMATVADDPAYSNVQNGWYYDLVSVTNSFGVTTNYRVYRTKNTLSGTITITVS